MLSDHAAVAKAIRTEMKKNGIKGTVRAESYSGGSSVRVSLEDELPATAKAIKSFASKYKMGHFDGMTDIYEISNSRDDIPQVSYVVVNNHFSDEIRQAAWDYCRNYWADMENAPEDCKEAGSFMTNPGLWGNMLIERTLREPRGFWTSYKTRVAA